MHPPEQDNTMDPQPPGSWLGSDYTRPARYTSQASQSRRTRDAYRAHPRSQQRNQSHRLSRDDLRNFADLTLRTLDSGCYMPPASNISYNLTEKMEYTDENTEYFPPDDPEIEGWATAELQELPQDRRTRIFIKQYSTLVGARTLHGMLQAHPEVENRRIGVLNFASAKKPGGGFINGAQAQEESLARSSTLYPSLISNVATQFYAHYVEDPDNPYYTHAMVYSPGIVFIRNDKGEWKKPVEADVLTSAAVNAGEVRQKLRWEEDMRLLRARVRVAEAARAREAEQRQRREDERRRQREEQRRKILAEQRANAAELRRKKEQEKARAKQAKEKEGGDAASQTEKMEVDETDTTQPADVQMGQPHKEPDEDKEDKEETTVQQDGKRKDSTRPDSAVPSTSHPSAPAPNPAEIPLPRTPTPERPPISTLLALAEIDINKTMRERIGRLLYLFYKRGAHHLILGSFGTGVFQNSIETVAEIFLDFLAKPDGRFYNVFETVVFAILDEPTVKEFRKVFRDAGIGMDNDEAGAEDTESGTEEQQDGKSGIEDQQDGKSDEGQVKQDEVVRRADEPVDPGDENAETVSASTHTTATMTDESVQTDIHDAFAKLDEEQPTADGTQLEQADVTMASEPPVVEANVPMEPVVNSEAQHHNTMPMPAPI